MNAEGTDIILRLLSTVFEWSQQLGEVPGDWYKAGRVADMPEGSEEAYGIALECKGKWKKEF